MASLHVAAVLALAVVSAAVGLPSDDPLPSWKDTASRRALLAFVEEVTREGSPRFVPPAERIAVFDNDGTLWGEQPLYFQLAFALDRVRALAPEHPEWKETEPFASVLGGDLAGVMAGGEQAVLELVMATHAGLTAEEFAAAVDDWIRTAKHPVTGRLYAEMVYQPMLEVLDHLRANGFKTFIVSGGGVDFMRGFAERVYGIPPEQVVGSAIAATYELRDGRPVIVKQPELDFLDDKAGKPVGIHRAIGRRPILAFGNSDGDREMLQYATVGSPRPGLALIVHHTDSEREVAYDRESHIGRLDAALDEAAERGWTVVDMQADWKRVFPWR
jgi:phosphoglycolate phosphatase-like HAD superfamily hydrolase